MNCRKATCLCKGIMQVGRSRTSEVVSLFLSRWAGPVIGSDGDRQQVINSRKWLSILKRCCKTTMRIIRRKRPTSACHVNRKYEVIAVVQTKVRHGQLLPLTEAVDVASYAVLQCTSLMFHANLCTIYATAGHQPPQITCPSLQHCTSPPTPTSLSRWPMLIPESKYDPNYNSNSRYIDAGLIMARA